VGTRSMQMFEKALCNCEDNDVLPRSRHSGSRSRDWHLGTSPACDPLCPWCVVAELF
jgi:hypothetical protein